MLEWFEQHRIPVDYIAGTSMGGLVGAMYAIGKSPAELRQLVTSLDWDILLRGYPSFQQLSYRRKEDRLNIPGPITFGLKNGTHLPAGMNAGMEVNLVFDRYSMPYDLVHDFNDLPIPFQCVATDLVAGEPVVLKDGSLSRSLRATMSIPGLFTPVQLNGKTLADGGGGSQRANGCRQGDGCRYRYRGRHSTPLGDKDSINGLWCTEPDQQVATMRTSKNIRLMTC